MRTLVFFGVFILCSLLYTQPISAQASCDGSATVWRNYEIFDVIFIGTVQESIVVNREKGFFKNTIRIEEVFKGNLPGGDLREGDVFRENIILYNEPHQMLPGKKYLIYASKLKIRSFGKSKDTKNTYGTIKDPSGYFFLSSGCTPPEWIENVPPKTLSILQELWCNCIP